MELSMWGRVLAAGCLCLLLPGAAALLQGDPSAQGQDSENTLRGNFDSIAELIPVDPKAEDDYKRSQSFFPLRGKKTPDAIYQLLSEHDDKRSQFYPLRGKKIPEDLKRVSYFMPMRGRKDDYPWVGEDSFEEEPDKRASSFMPMRGKKRQLLQKTGMYPTSDTSSSSNSSCRNSSSSRADLQETLDGRRSPQQTGNTRSKRSLLPRDSEGRNLMSVIMENVSKVPRKRSLGFYANRGKRIVDRDSPDDDNSDGDSGEVVEGFRKRKFSFYPMRGRRCKNVVDQSLPIVNIIEDSEADNGSSNLAPMKTEEGEGASYDNLSKHLPYRRESDAKDGVVYPLDSEGDFSLSSRHSTSDYFGNNPARPESGRDSLIDRFDGLEGSDISLDGNGLQYQPRKRSSYFSAMRGRRSSREDVYSFHSLFLPGIGSSFMIRPDVGRTASRGVPKRRRVYDWDSVKRAFHASRGKRLENTSPEEGHQADLSDEDNASRSKRSYLRSRILTKPNRHYIALKRPMSFFATRGKRRDRLAADDSSSLH